MFKASRSLDLPYLVHFEDNEDHLSALRLVWGARGRLDPEGLAPFSQNSKHSNPIGSSIAGDVSSRPACTRLAPLLQVPAGARRR